MADVWNGSSEADLCNPEPRQAADEHVLACAAKLLPATRHVLINSNAFAIVMNVLPERLGPWGRLSPLHHIRKRRMGEDTALTKGAGWSDLAFLCCLPIFA